MCIRDSIKDVDKFFEVVDSCNGKVELVTGEGDRLNLKSKLSQYVSLANIFSGGEMCIRDSIITVMWIPASILYSFQTSICAREEEIWTDTECIIIRKCSVTCLTCRRSGILQDPLRYLKCDRINERKASERSYL